MKRFINYSFLGEQKNLIGVTKAYMIEYNQPNKMLNSHYPVIGTINTQEE